MTAFEFIKERERLILIYSPYAGDRWLMEQYEDAAQDRISLGRAFSFAKSDVLAAGERDTGLIQEFGGDDSTAPV